MGLELELEPPPELEPDVPVPDVGWEAAGELLTGVEGCVVVVEELLTGVEGCVVVVGNGEYHGEDAGEYHGEDAGEYHGEDAGAWLALTVELIGLAPALDDGGEAAGELWAGAEAWAVVVMGEDFGALKPTSWPCWL